MFGTLGMQEIVVIFILALLLFGPKKLPELGRTFGKALTEFRRAQAELKSTFDREMRNLEQETASLKEVTKEYQYDTYNYDYSSYENSYEGSYGSETHESTAATTPSTASASAPQGAESPSAVPPEGTIAHGTELAALPAPGEHPQNAATNGHAEHSSATAEHSA
ncbi:MAG TPA: twin-arginine translocase TatA/TatE family subunit [Bryobacteraceae bacterium]|nr:twin-arginine translocase TatA/TatE family subunit [Bryobacteraceae bacterium]